MTDKEFDINQYEHLILRYLSDELSDNEIIKLKEWLSGSEKNMKLFFEIQSIWIETGKQKRYDTGEAWLNVKSNVQKKKILLRRFLSYAAGIFILMTVGVWLIFTRDNYSENIKQSVVLTENNPILILSNDEKIVLNANDRDLQVTEYISQKTSQENGDNETLELNRLITPRGAEYAIELPDGSKVWLNADSELKFPDKFDTDKRVVYLTGEAYFKVARNEKSRFTVVMNDSKVTVLGTEFNIRNYEGEEIAATLVNGSVRVDDSFENNVILEPGQQALLREGVIEVQDVQLEHFISWKDGFFVYRDKSMGYVLNELSRWYDFEYEFENEEIKEIVLTAKLRKFDSVEKVFEVLTETGKYKFIKKGDTIVVKNK